MIMPANLQAPSEKLPLATLLGDANLCQLGRMREP